MSFANGSTIIQVPSGVERLAHVRRGADRVAHVVQAVEDADEVVVAAGIVLGGGDLEGDAVADAGLRGRLAGALDRGVVVVEAEELASSGTPRP